MCLYTVVDLDKYLVFFVAPAYISRINMKFTRLRHDFIIYGYSNHGYISMNNILDHNIDIDIDTIFI